MPRQERPAGNVHHHLGQRLVQRAQRVGVAGDAGLVAQRLGEQRAQHDAAILGRVVVVDVPVTPGGKGDVEQAVASQLDQHVVQEADAGLDRVRAGAVQHQAGGNFCLGRLAAGLGGAHPLWLETRR